MAKKKTKRRRYGILNEPPVIVDFKLGFSTGAMANLGFSYCGPVPKLDVNPKDIPMMLRALADKLEELQAEGATTAASFAEGMKIGADTAKASKRRSARSK